MTWMNPVLNSALSPLRPTATRQAAVEWLRHLASGGAGDVWLGVWKNTGALVVGKSLRENANPDARRGFAREVRILLRNFPGMVRVFAADVSGPRPYYVMEFLPNGSLTAWAGRLNRDQLRLIVSDAAAYLASLHAAAIAHGDVKPDNMLLDQNGRLRISDPIGCGWGCTHLFAENRGGTPGYWAPEILRDAVISPAADVWSFGATVHHLATGVRPRDGVPFSLRAPIFFIAPELAEIVRACCNTDASKRATMGDIPALLSGGSWDRIHANREAWKFGLTAGTVGLLLAALAKKN
jgi:serine/threonine protein kinase